MRNYVRAYQDLTKSGFVKESIIEKHVEQHIAIDAFLPESASFFLYCRNAGEISISWPAAREGFRL